MDPVSMTAAVSAIGSALPSASTLAAGSAALGAAGTLYGAASEARAMKQQAEADQARSIFEQQQAGRLATEARAAAQQDAFEENRQTRLLKSRLGAVAGASGSGVSDPGVVSLLEGIERQGSSNAQRAMAAGDQRAQSMIYQANLNRWGADMQSRIRRSAARSTLIGGALSSAGQFGSSISNLKLSTPMGAKYGSGRSYATGYGS